MKQLDDVPMSVGRFLREEFLHDTTHVRLAAACNFPDANQFIWLSRDEIFFTSEHAARLERGTAVPADKWVEIHHNWRQYFADKFTEALKDTPLPEWARCVYPYERELIISDGCPGGENHTEAVPLDNLYDTAHFLSLCFEIKDGKLHNA